MAVTAEMHVSVSGPGPVSMTAHLLTSTFSNQHRHRKSHCKRLETGQLTSPRTSPTITYHVHDETLGPSSSRRLPEHPSSRLKLLLHHNAPTSHVHQRRDARRVHPPRQECCLPQDRRQGGPDATGTRCVTDWPNCRHDVQQAKYPHPRVHRGCRHDAGWSCHVPGQR